MKLSYKPNNSPYVFEQSFARAVKMSENSKYGLTLCFELKLIINFLYHT